MDSVGMGLSMYVVTVIIWILLYLIGKLCTRVAAAVRERRDFHEADHEIRRAVVGAPPENRRREAECCSVFVYDTYAKERSAGEGGVGGGCAICLDEYADGERRATVAACNHRFHAFCIEAWVAEKRFNEPSTCPLCRHDLV